MKPSYCLYLTAIGQDERPRRIRETIAVEDLVRRVFGAGAVKRNLPSGKPVVELPEGGSPTVSISHSAKEAVLVVSCDGTPVGVDIEEFRPALRRVVPKFLNPDEVAAYTDDDALLKAWTLKEATYKAACTPGLSLLDIRLPFGDDIIRLSDGRTFRVLESRFYGDSYISVVGG